jgi:putative thioredoxin
VLAFRNGQPVDAFVGVVPESQVRAFFERVMPTIAEQRVAEARQLEATDPDAALAKYREAVADSGPLESAARIALAAFLLARGMLDECHAQIAELEQRGYLEPEAEQVKARLLLERGSHEAGSLEQARAKVRAHPDDFAARLHLAEALAAAGEHAEALETALDLVERDRKGTGEAARKLMIAIFNLLSNDSPLAADFRRRLSFVL